MSEPDDLLEIRTPTDGELHRWLQVNGHPWQQEIQEFRGEFWRQLVVLVGAACGGHLEQVVCLEDRCDGVARDISRSDRIDVGSYLGVQLAKEGYDRYAKGRNGRARVVLHE